MSSGGVEEGNCKICNSYTKNVSYKWHRICLDCYNKIDRNTKESLLYEIHMLKRQMKKLREFL